jgi:predicted TIM-barrel fold metal-dependent hydrolase
MTDQTCRRAFLKTAAMSAAGWLYAASDPNDSVAGDADRLYEGEIIDTHQHLWDLKEFKLPWIGRLTGKGKEILGRSYGLNDYAVASEGLHVKRAVYMEVDVAENEQLKEVEFIAKVCAGGKAPTVAAVVSGRPAADGFKDYLDLLKGNKYIKGLRQVLHTPATPPKFCLDDKFVKGVQVLGERGLSFDLCFKNDQLEHGAALIDRCPETRFILDHCGNPHDGMLDLEGWKKALAKIAGAKNRNVMCKVSGLYANVTAEQWPAEKLAPLVRTVIDHFGWDRVLFASDWPVVNLGASFKIWCETVKQIVRSDKPENQAKLFRDNAVKFYGLA